MRKGLEGHLGYLPGNAQHPQGAQGHWKRSRVCGAGGPELGWPEQQRGAVLAFVLCCVQGRSAFGQKSQQVRMDSSRSRVWEAQGRCDRKGALPAASVC